MAPFYEKAMTFGAYFKGTILKEIVAKNLAELKVIVIEKLEILKKDTTLLQNFFRNKKIAFMQT